MWEKQLAIAIKAAELAKREILKIYRTKFVSFKKKDGSPVTNADKNADKIIREYLHKQYPEYAILSEESADNKTRLNNDYVWIIDPLDGTYNFIDKNDEFTINIALIHKHKVVLGVILVPVTDEIYYATNHGGAFKSKNGSVREINVSRKVDDLHVLLSRSHHGKHEEAILKKYGNKIKKKTYIGAAIKACMIASGEAELSFILSNKTKEWDTAACQILIKEAGGVYLEPHGTWLTYNRENIVNKNGYVIANRRKNIIF